MRLSLRDFRLSISSGGRLLDSIPERLRASAISDFDTIRVPIPFSFAIEATHLATDSGSLGICLYEYESTTLSPSSKMTPASISKRICCMRVGPSARSLRLKGYHRSATWTLVNTSSRALLGRFELENPLILASGILGVTVASLRRAIDSGAGCAISKSIGL